MHRWLCSIFPEEHCTIKSESIVELELALSPAVKGVLFESAATALSFTLTLNPALGLPSGDWLLWSRSGLCAAGGGVRLQQLSSALPPLAVSMVLTSLSFAMTKYPGRRLCCMWCVRRRPHTWTHQRVPRAVEVGRRPAAFHTYMFRLASYQTGTLSCAA